MYPTWGQKTWEAKSPEADAVGQMVLTSPQEHGLCLLFLGPGLRCPLFKKVTGAKEVGSVAESSLVLGNMPPDSQRTRYVNRKRSWTVGDMGLVVRLTWDWISTLSIPSPSTGWASTVSKDKPTHLPETCWSPTGLNHVWCFSLSARTPFYTYTLRLTLIAFLAIWHSTLWPCSLLPLPKNECQCVCDFCYGKTIL